MKIETHTRVKALIEKGREDHGLSLRDLGDLCGVADNTIKTALEGETTEITARGIILSLEEYFDVRKSESLIGNGVWDSLARARAHAEALREELVHAHDQAHRLIAPGIERHIELVTGIIEDLKP